MVSIVIWFFLIGLGFATLYGIFKILYAVFGKSDQALEQKQKLKGFISGTRQEKLEKPTAQLVGSLGVVYTALKPSGKVLVAGEIYDAMGIGGEWLNPGTEVKVISIGIAGTLRVKEWIAQ